MANDQRRLGFGTDERRRKKTRLATHRIANFKKGDRVMWSDSFLERGRRIDPKWYALRKNERGTVDWIQRDGDVLVQWDNEHTTTVHPPDRLTHATDRVLEEHTVSDFNTMDDLLAHARDELGATHVAFIDDETHLYFKRADGAYEKAEVWQKDSYWHAQGPGSRAVVRKLPADARPIGGGRGRRATEVRTEPTAALIEDFAKDIAAFAKSSKITFERAYDDISKPAWVRNFKGNMIDLENRIINKAKSIGRRMHDGQVARDYIAVDTRGRTIAGPFKSYSDAKGAAGPGGHVEYVRETGTAGVFEVDEAGGGFYTEAPNNGHRVAIGGRGEVIPSRRWKNKRTGATASPYGAVPWTGAPGDRKEDWELENVGWTIQWADGTTGIGRVPFPTREEAEDWLERDRARREAARRALPPWEPPKRTKRRAREARPRPKAKRSTARRR